MGCKVLVTSEAESDFDNILNYLVNGKSNPQAAEHFIDDFEKTKTALSEVAVSLKLCDNPGLSQFGYRRINFLTMDYFLLYRTDGKTATIDGIFHFLQDYGNKMR